MDVAITQPGLARRLRGWLLPWLALLTSAAAAAVPITTQPLGDLLSALVQDAPATVVPANAPDLAAEITARIERVRVRVGDRVAPGDVLVELDCRPYASRLAAARATLQELETRAAFAADQLARARDLKSTRSISEEIVDQRRSERDSLLAQQQAQRQAIVQAELDVERCVIRAPFVAVVTGRQADVGGLAVPGAVLLRLVALEDPEISAALRESEVDGLARAAEIALRYDGRSYPARVRSILPVVQERQLTREVRLAFAAATAPIGAAGRLVWHDGRNRLPAEYLVRRDQQLGIFVVEDGSARFVALPEAVEGRPVVVDLPPQTALVIDGRQRLVDGDAVIERGAGR